jgi:hypothetical protein
MVPEIADCSVTMLHLEQNNILYFHQRSEKPNDSSAEDVSGELVAQGFDIINVR